MAVDDNILKTLESIEKMVRSSMSAAGSRLPNSAQRNAQARDLRATRDANKTFGATVAGASNLNTQFTALHKTLGLLDVQVGKTVGNFSALNAQLARYQGAPQSTITPPVNVQQQSYLTGMVAKIFNRNNTALNNGISPIVTPLTRQGPMLSNALGSIITRLGSVGITSYSLEKTFENLWIAAKKLAVDFLTLSRLGLGSTANLGGLSIDAAKAGMSLKEYTTLLQQNSSAVSRANSLDAFNQMISAADSQLANMGIFGAEARGLQASLAESSTEMGISQKNLTAVVADQIEVFRNLQKTTLITADQFGSLVNSLSKNEQVQREMQALAPRERMVRQAELVQIATTGQRLGLTAEASQKLSEALISQRKSTVQERLDTAGTILQAAAFTGLDGGRAAELSRKKRRTADEDRELMQFISVLDSAVQGMGESQNLALQHVGEQFEEALHRGPLGQLIDANRGATLAQESSPAGINKSFGVHVSEFGKAVGQLTAFARGLQESVAGPLVAGVTGALGVFFRGPITNILGNVISKLTFGRVAFGGAAAGATAQTVGIAGAAAEASTVSSTIVSILESAKKIGWISGIIGAIIEGFTGDIADALNPSGGFFNRIGGIVTAFFTAIPNVIFDAIGFVFGDKAGNKLQRGFDIVVTFMNMAIRDFLSKIVSDIGSALTWLLPKDSALAKMVTNAGASLNKAAAENGEALTKLWDNDNATLKSLATDNRKTAEGAVKATKAATVQAAQAQSNFNNVAYGPQGLPSILSDARAIMGQPQVQVPQTVAPAPVNTSTAQATTPGVATAVIPQTSNPETVAVMQQVLQVLRDMLQAENKQVENSEALLRGNRRPVVFQDSELMTNRLLQGTS